MWELLSESLLSILIIETYGSTFTLEESDVWIERIYNQDGINTLVDMVITDKFKSNTLNLPSLRSQCLPFSLLIEGYPMVWVRSPTRITKIFSSKLKDCSFNWNLKLRCNAITNAKPLQSIENKMENPSQSAPMIATATWKRPKFREAMARSLDQRLEWISRMPCIPHICKYQNQDPAWNPCIYDNMINKCHQKIGNNNSILDCTNQHIHLKFYFLILEDNKYTISYKYLSNSLRINQLDWKLNVRNEINFQWI